MKFRPAQTCSEPTTLLSPAPTGGASDQADVSPPLLRRALVRFILALAVLAAAFSPTLIALGRMAADSDLYSYILLMPCVVAGFAWWRAAEIRAAGVSMTFKPAAACAIIAAVLLALRFSGIVDLAARPEVDRLAWGTLTFLILVLGAALACFGTAVLRCMAGPIALLVFMIPLPLPVLQALERFLQHGSAMMAEPLFLLWGTPYLRDGLIFRLPNVALQVAPQCSGINATMVLWIIGLVASLLLLRRPWTRAVLILAVIPLALARNGLRIFVLGQLTVDHGRHILDSWVHSRGGPLFFVLSMIPFAILLALLLWLERRRHKTTTTAAVVAPTSASISA